MAGPAFLTGRIFFFVNSTDRADSAVLSARLSGIETNQAPPRISSAWLALHAEDLLQGVPDPNKIILGGHYAVDVLVGSWRFVKNAAVFPALDPLGVGNMIPERDGFSGPGPRHGSSGTVGTGAVGGLVSEPFHD